MVLEGVHGLGGNGGAGADQSYADRGKAVMCHGIWSEAGQRPGERGESLVVNSKPL